MKIQLYDSKGRQIRPITTEKAKQLAKAGKIKAISKKPPKMKLLKDDLFTPLSRALFMFEKKHGPHALRTVAIVSAIALCVIGVGLGVFMHSRDSEPDPNELIVPTAPQETQKVIKETTTKAPTTTEAQSTVADETHVYRTTTPTTTKATTEKATQAKKKKKKTEPTTRNWSDWDEDEAYDDDDIDDPSDSDDTDSTQSDSGLPSPAGEDELPSPADDSDEALPVL